MFREPMNVHDTKYVRLCRLLWGNTTISPALCERVPPTECISLTRRELSTLRGAGLNGMWNHLQTVLSQVLSFARRTVQQGL